MRIVVLNGPNLNLLGQREPHIYGQTGLDQLMCELRDSFPSIELTDFQSNIEGELVNHIQNASACFNGVILNAAGYTHTSVAIRDAIAACSVPVVEVHLSNIFAREDFRHVSLIGGVCQGSISGFGAFSYHLAVRALLQITNSNH